MHTAADDAVDDDHVAAGIRLHSRADIHTQTDPNRRRQDLSVEAAGSGSGSDFDEYHHDTHEVDKHSAAVHIHCGAIPAEYRSRREHLGNDNWSEMGTAGHNRMQWPAAAAAAAAAEIAVTVRSSEVDSRRNVGTGSGRSREADEAVEEGDRHSRTRQIRTSDSLRRDNLEQEAEVHYFPSRHEPPGPIRPRRRPDHDAPHAHGGHRHGAAAAAGRYPEHLRQRRSPCFQKSNELIFNCSLLGV